MIQQLDNVLEAVRDRVFANFESIDPSEAQLLFRVYGQNGVMDDLEPLTGQRPHEVGLVIEVVAKPNCWLIRCVPLPVPRCFTLAIRGDNQPRESRFPIFAI